MQILSIPAQLEELRRFAERQGLSVTTELTEKCSAREPGRPVFSELLQDIAARKVERILSWKLDRLARNPIDGGALIHHLGKGYLKEIVTPEGTYTGTGDSKFMLSVLFGAATKMTDDLSVAVRRGNRSIFERGRINGPPPLGYIKIHDAPGFRGAGKTVPDPIRFTKLRAFWTRVLNGMPIIEARQFAIREGLTMRSTYKCPERIPSISYLYQVLRNPFYSGLIVRNGVVHQGEHLPLVTLEEFRRTKEVLGDAINAPRASRHSFLYTGQLYCGQCERVLIGERIKGRYIYYRCGRPAEGVPRCKSKAPPEGEVTAGIKQHLASLAIDQELASWTIEFLERMQQFEDNDRSERKTEYERRIASVDAQLKRLTDFAIAGHLPDCEFVERRAQLQGERQLLQEQFTDADAESSRWHETVRHVLTRANQLLAAYEEANFDEKRDLLRETYKTIIVHDGKPTPVARFPYSLLEEHRPFLEPASKPQQNFPSTTEMALSIRQNSRPRCARKREFLAWCSKWVRRPNESRTEG